MLHKFGPITLISAGLFTAVGSYYALKSFIGDSEFQLIEALAEESVKLIFEKFNVNYIKGRFSKPGAVTGSKEVGVIIERYRDST